MAEKCPTIVDFAGCDYLGLASHPVVVESLCKAARDHRISAGSSRWGLGWTDFHEQLESELARMTGMQAACLLSSAYMGGAVYFGEVGCGGRVAFCDELIHSNLWLGIRAAGTHATTFAHLDTDDLARHLARHVGSQPIIATDGVYGISGEVAPVRELAELADRHDAELLIDDAHGFGAIGQAGGGVIEQIGMPGDNVTVLGSMSKAMGCSGGFLAGRRELVERFRRSATVSSSTPLPVPVAAACLAALKLIQTDVSLRQRLRDNERYMRTALAEHDIDVVADGAPIIAMSLPDEQEASRLADHFLACGLRIPYFKYASEPRTNLLRAAARSIYTQENLDRFAHALATR